MKQEILGKFEVGWKQSLVPSFPSRSKTLAMAAKTYGEKGIKDFCWFPFLRDVFALSNQFFCGIETYAKMGTTINTF